MVREADDGAENSVKPIEIPPPRMKRKPLQPYPRKSVEMLKRPSPSNQMERSPSPNSLVSQKEHRSPTSVLSAAASRTLESDDHPNGCSSPASCTSDVNSGPLRIGKKTELKFSELSYKEGKGFLSSAQLSSSPILEKISSMVILIILCKMLYCFFCIIILKSAFFSCMLISVFVFCNRNVNWVQRMLYVLEEVEIL